MNKPAITTTKAYTTHFVYAKSSADALLLQLKLLLLLLLLQLKTEERLVEVCSYCSLDAELALLQ